MLSGLILSLALPAVPLLGEAPVRVPVAATGRFVFYSDFEPNLNDALIAAGVARRFGKPELFRAGAEMACFAKLPEAERAGWDGAAEFYAKDVSPTGSNSTPRFLIRAQIAGFEDELRDDADRTFATKARNSRLAAAPAYRACRWTAQDAANRRWIEALKTSPFADERKIGPRLEELYRRTWAAEPIPVDVVQTVDFSGANTILRDPGRGHILIAIENPDRAALEVVFHEASHILMGGGAPVRQALDDAAKAAGFQLPGEASHVVLFYTTGEVVRRTLAAEGAPAYTPMLYEIFERGTWGEYRGPLERAWLPYIKGERPLPDAATGLIAELARQAKIDSRPSPPGYTTTRTGDVHDFDYFEGGWTTRQRRLKARGAGSTEWEEFPATLCMTLYLGGMATVDELHFPTKGWAGLTLRTFDLAKRQWSIYWVSSANGRMDVPVVGGFDGKRGEFYGEDLDDGRRVKVRFTWNKVDRDHARWEQAFSYNDRTWETNWTADFTRADTPTTCAGGRPKR